MDQDSREVTLVLEELFALDEHAPDDRREALQKRLYTLVYAELRNRAAQQLRGERQRHLLQPTELVNEAYLVLVDYRMRFESRAHFLNVAAQAMRRILIDRARAHASQKRGAGVRHESLDGLNVAQAAEREPETLLALDEALEVLDRDQTRLVELRYFLGLTFNEAAEALEANPDTLRKRWQAIRVLLYDRLSRVSARRGGEAAGA